MGLHRILPAALAVLSIASPVILSAQAAPQDVPATQSKEGSKSNSPSVPLSEHQESATHTESWSNLSLAASGLSASTFNAVLLGKTEQPLYTRELVRMQWRTGDPIDVYIVLPHGISKPQPILYLYDYKSDSERFRDEGWCTRATKNGFAAIGFLPALSEERFHSPRPMKQWFVSELQESLATSTHDVQLILNYLASRGDLEVKSTGMIAQGSGGAIAILAASVDQRIVALDLMNPWGDWPDWLKSSPQIPSEERANFITPAFLQKVAPLDPVLYLPQLKIKALRLQQIMDDPTVPAEARDKLSKAMPKTKQSSVELVRYKDQAEHQAAWRNEGLSGWMRTQLQTSPSSQPASGATATPQAGGE